MHGGGCRVSTGTRSIKTEHPDAIFIFYSVFSRRIELGTKNHVLMKVGWRGTRQPPQGVRGDRAHRENAQRAAGGSARGETTREAAFATDYF